MARAILGCSAVTLIAVSLMDDPIHRDIDDDDASTSDVAGSACQPALGARPEHDSLTAGGCLTFDHTGQPPADHSQEQP